MLPPADAILCRWVLNHLMGPYVDGVRDDERIEMALDNFKQSARYLFLTQFDTPQGNEISKLDLREHLGDYAEICRDGPMNLNGQPYECLLAMWEC